MLVRLTVTLASRRHSSVRTPTLGRISGTTGADCLAAALAIKIYPDLDKMSHHVFHGLVSSAACEEFGNVD